MDDPSAQWQAKRTHASQNEVTLTGLTSKAVYCFKFVLNVRVVSVLTVKYVIPFKPNHHHYLESLVNP